MCVKNVATPHAVSNWEVATTVGPTTMCHRMVNAASNQGLHLETTNSADQKKSLQTTYLQLMHAAYN